MKKLDLNSAAALSAVEASAWPALQIAAEVLTGDKGVDPGIDTECTFTSGDTVENWDDSAANHWREVASKQVLEIEGYPARKFTGVQVAKGHQRRNVLVVQLADGCLTQQS